MNAPVAEAVSANGPGVASMMLSLGLVIALIFALAYLVRRLQSLRGIRRSQLQLIGGLSVGAKERVVLVQLGDQQYLIGVAAGSVNLLQRLDQPLNAESVSEPLPAGSFAERLRQMLGQSS